MSPRAPHLDDARLFGPDALPRLRAAAEEMAYLRDRDYSTVTALSAVANHHQLELRQRAALSRGVCSAAELARRRANELQPAALAGQDVCIDGFNLMISIEVALGGGVLVQGRDGCLRDVLGLRGSYRVVDETMTAIGHILRSLGELGVSRCAFCLDRGVSNSGRLRVSILDAAAAASTLPVDVELASHADALLVRKARVVSADGPVIERCRGYCNLAREIIARGVPAAHVVALFPEG
jgi:hypothetical protein